MTASIAFRASVLHEAERELEAATSRVALPGAGERAVAVEGGIAVKAPQR